MAQQILVIEDEKTIRQSIAALLEAVGYEVLVAINGREGVTVARKHLPDLIVCDVMMPELDGYGTLLELQQHHETVKIPFIFLTAKSTWQDVRRGMSLGADDYLTKPIDVQDLLDAVANRLQKAQSLKESMAFHSEKDLRYYLDTVLPHELRTPITGVKGYLRLLLDDYAMFTADQIKEILSRVDVSTDRIIRLIENHLLYAQLQLLEVDEMSQAVILEHARLDNIDEVIADLATNLAARYDRSADLRIELTPGKVAILGDNAKKLFYEIIDNAFKFSPNGTLVSVDASVTAQSYVVRIEDCGDGLTPNQVSAIGPNRQFGRYKHEQQGVGLGLVIAKRLTELFQGDLVLEASVNGGLAVIVHLPLVKETQD